MSSGSFQHNHWGHVWQSPERAFKWYSSCLGNTDSQLEKIKYYVLCAHLGQSDDFWESISPGMTVPGEKWRSDVITRLCFNLLNSNMLCQGMLILKERLGCLQANRELKMELLGFCGVQKLEAACQQDPQVTAIKGPGTLLHPHECYTVLIVVNTVVSKATVEQCLLFS